MGRKGKGKGRGLLDLVVTEVNLDHNVKFNIILEQPGDKLWAVSFIDSNRHCDTIREYIREKWNLSDSLVNFLIERAFSVHRQRLVDAMLEYDNQIEVNNLVGSGI